MTAERISVVLPVYNERENIAPCLTGLARALKDVEHEILVCYDFDEDTTLEGIRAMGDAAPKSVRLVKNTLGRGPHNALKAGFQAASGDVVVTTMADLSDPPELIPAMAAKIRSGCAVVSGSRYMPGGTQKGGPLLKRTMSRVAGVSLAWLAGMGTHDATSNFRAYSTRFLRETVIEATAGFEIALELTVKAHLEGRGVGEVPSSWVDRAAGESRFRLWKWLPNYLRWYGRAMREPAAVWLVWLAALASALWSVGGANHELARIAVWTCALASAASVLWARRLRGRSAWIDAVLPMLALAPPALVASTPASVALFGARALAMLVCVALTTPRGRWIASLRSGAAHVDERGLGVLLLVLLVWSAHLSPVATRAGAELDPSWQQSLGRALREGLRFGHDVLFTYGPFGYFLQSPHDPALYWTKTLVFELAFKLLAAGFVVAVAMRIGRVLERAAFLLAATVPMIGDDAWALLVVTCVAVWLALEPDRPVLREALGLAVLAVLALVKFTFFVYGTLAVLLFAAACLRTRGLHRALRTPAVLALLVLALWIGAGQRPFDLPAYVASSLSITSGYSVAMGQDSDPFTLELGAQCLFACFAIAALAFATSIRGRAAPAAALTLAAGAFLAFKAGFVRNGGNAVTLFGFAATAPLAVAALEAVGPTTRLPRLLRGTGAGLRLALCVFALYGFGVARQHPGQTIERLFTEWSHESTTRAAAILDFQRQETELRDADGALSASTGLPNVSARVGRATVDLIANKQGILHANDLEWKPRPAFQSYVAYTPELLRRNAEFLAGPDAPRYVLFQFETIDQRLPNLDDTLALQVLSRDWRPVLEEGEFLLLERRPDAKLVPLAKERPVVLQRELEYGEWLDLGALEGRCHVLAADLRLTTRGKLETLLLHAPSCWMELQDSEKRKATFRVVAPILSQGVLVDPFLISNADWATWFDGGAPARIVRLRFLCNEAGAVGRLLEPRIPVRVTLAEDIVPATGGAVERIDRFPMLPTKPMRLTTRFPWYPTNFRGEDVLVVHAPSDILFDVKPGRWRLTGRFGILDSAWESGNTDGVSFAVVQDDEAGNEQAPLWKRLLKPVAVEADRGAQTLEVEFETTRRSPLYVRTRPGPRADTNSDWAWWTKLELVRLGDAAPR